MDNESPMRAGAAAGRRVENAFQVGAHTVRTIREMEGRWAVAVDATALQGTFRTQAEAWEAGVHEADRLDRTPK